MHMPSQRVRQEMISEAASIWYVPANDGAETAILIKAPTPSIKALVAGCSAKLTFGKSGNYLCTGAIIADVPDAPLVFSGIQRNLEEHLALLRILQDRVSPIFLFNEMDVCVAWANATLPELEATKVFTFIGNISELYIGPFTEETSHALDCFCFSFNQVASYSNASIIPTEELKLSVDSWNVITSYFYGENSFEPFTINNPEEGKSFEGSIWSALSSVFPNSLFKNVKILNGEKPREFTDVFAFHSYGSFLIEAKDLSVFSAGFQRKQSRRISGIQKQVKKAIGQLIGACKDFCDGKKIFSADGIEISVDRSQPPHCIVLITELPPVGEWEEIVDLLCNAMKETGAFFHLLDFQELLMLLKGSSGDSALFDYNLMQRSKLFWETKSVFIRSQPPSNEPG